MKHLKVTSSADSLGESGGGLAWWQWLLWILLLLLCCGLCLLAAAVGAKSQGVIMPNNPKDWNNPNAWVIPSHLNPRNWKVKMPFTKPAGNRNRELVPSSDPEDSPGRGGAVRALRVHFLDQNGIRRIFCFKSQPLGIVISDKDGETNVIEGFPQESYARDKGAKQGWQVVQVQDRLLQTVPAKGEVRKMLDEESRHLPPYQSNSNVAKDVKIHFLDTTGAERVFRFKSMPLGLKLKASDPSLVEGFSLGSYAKEKGVQENWRIKQVASEQVASTATVGDVESIIKENSAGLDQWPLKMEFDTGQGEIRTILCREGPLGMAFYNKLPLQIEDFKPTSTAKEMGVQTGWTLVAIGDVNVRHESRFDKVAGYLTEGISQLPSRDNVKPGVVLGRANSHC